MDINEILNNFGNFNNSPSFEILPPVEMDGKCRIIGISTYPAKREIDISLHTIPVEEKDFRSSQRSEVTDLKSITLKYEDLEWLATRLDGLRQAYGIKNGFDRGKKTETSNT